MFFNANPASDAFANQHYYTSCPHGCLLGKSTHYNSKYNTSVRCNGFHGGGTHWLLWAEVARSLWQPLHLWREAIPWCSTYMHAIMEAPMSPHIGPLPSSIMGAIVALRILLPRLLNFNLHKGLYQCPFAIGLLWFCALQNKNPTMKNWCHLLSFTKYFAYGSER